MKRGRHTSSSTLLAASGVLVDLDGCLWTGGALLPGARELFQEFAGRSAIVSNDSTHTPRQLADRLAPQGIRLAESHVCLAGALAIESAARRWPGARTMVLGTAAMRDEARAKGLKLDDVDPQLIVLLRDLDLTFDRLQNAARAAARGVPVIAANPDLTHPGSEGEINLETGSLLAALRTAAPGADVTVIGKPASGLFVAALERLGIEARDAVMIGDSPETDIAGASAAGIAGVLIGSHPGAVAPSLEALLRRASPGFLSTAVA
jgi:HAD superfamily hydrolase (TIGR01450 family)